MQGALCSIAPYIAAKMTEAWPTQLITAEDYFRLPGVVMVEIDRERLTITLRVTPDLMDWEIKRLEDYVEKFREVNTIIEIKRIGD
jgi:hypothetical protein